MNQVHVTLIDRWDGGLHAYSDDVPGLFLSHRDRVAVLADIPIALTTIIGEMVGEEIVVTAGGRSGQYWWRKARPVE